MIRGIYAKIFLWFWLTAFAAIAAVAFVTLVSGSQPLGRRWVGMSALFAANGSIQSYEQGGEPALRRYIASIEESKAIRAELFDPSGRDLLGRGVPPGAEALMQRWRQSAQPQYALALRWMIAYPVTTPRGKYLFVASLYPLRGQVSQALFPWGFKLLIALLAIAALCLLLAKNLATPIQALRHATRCFAEGELSVRASPALFGRNDELSDLAADFDRMAARIESLLQKQRELLGDISHELRSPLTRVNVSLELLRRGDSGALEKAQKDLDRIENMIAQILTLTRLQTIGAPNPQASVSLHELLGRIVEDAQLEAAGQGKSVVIEAADACEILGDPTLLRSCFENVIRNAVRYTRPQTRVRVRLRKLLRNGLCEARLLVADEGEGVASEALDQLFEPFYRVSSARDAGTGGYGLGLAITRRVATSYGGSAVARHCATGGLEVEICLPLEDEP